MKNDDRVWRENPSKNIHSWSARTDGNGNARNNFGGAQPYREPGSETLEEWCMRQLTEERFFEKTWFIVLALIVFWPVGLGLLIYKIFIKKPDAPPPLSSWTYETPPIKKVKKAGRGSKVAGWVLLIIGLITIVPQAEHFGLTEFIYSLAFITGGILLIINGKRKEGSLKAGAMSERKARKAAEKAREDEARARAAMSAEERQICRIREAIPQIDDADVVRALCSIDQSLKRINERLKESPDLNTMSSVVKLKDTFLPETVELIDKYLEKSVGPETMVKIKEMLITCAEAYREIEEKVYSRSDIDTQVDIEVLRKTMEREGLLGSDFDL